MGVTWFWVMYGASSIDNWSVFAASVLVGLGSVATPAIVTFLVRNRARDSTYPFFFTVCTASLGLGQLSVWVDAANGAERHPGARPSGAKRNGRRRSEREQKAQV